MGEERAKLLETLSEGAIVHGVVQEHHRYGALSSTLGASTAAAHHRTWPGDRVRHPSEVVQVGQELTAKVLKFDAEKTASRWASNNWRRSVARRVGAATRRHAFVRQDHTSADYGASSKSDPASKPGARAEMDWTTERCAGARW